MSADLTPSALRDALLWRYATKSFDPARSIPADTWQALTDGLVLTPSSFGLQPWKFLQIEDAALRERLRECSWGQAQVTDADKLLVFTARTDVTPDDVDRWLVRMAEVQGQSRETLAGLGGVIEGFCQRMSPEQRHAWNVRQCYIALGQFMTSAALLGIDTCPLEGIDPAGYDRVLGLEGGSHATCVACVAGYRAAGDAHASRAKARYPREQVLEIR